MSHHPLTITAAATVAPRLKRFSVRPAYAGGPLRVSGYPLPVVVDLAGLVADDRLPVVLDHEQGKRVGHIDSVEISATQLDLAGAVSAAGSHAAEFLATAANSFPWQASIEALPMAELATVRAGESAEVNGQQHSGPVLVSRSTRLLGLSFVTRGADSNTQVLVAQQKGHSMSDTSNTSTTDPIQAERQRLSQIESACTGVDFDQPEHRQQLAELRASAIAGDTTIGELQQGVIRLLRDSRPQAHTVHGRPRHEGPKPIEAALAMSCGLSQPEKHFAADVLEAADRYKGFGLQQLLLAAASQGGYDARPGEHVNASNLQPILRAAFRPIHAAGFSTVNLPGILSNNANKFVREGFMSVDQTALRVSGRANVRDFKEHTTYSLTGDHEYLEVGAGGELKHGTAGERSYANQAKTYGRMFSITRQDIINDDLDALTAVPRRIGRGAMLKLNDVFWTTFLDNSSFFAAGNNNVVTGAGSALALAGLEAVEVVFANQTDPDGKPLGIMPAILLVPPTLRHTARQLMNSGAIVTGEDTTIPAGNTFQGAFTVESSPYMENTSYIGYSSAAWYLLADPMTMPVVTIAFLNGMESPTIETADADFNTLGISMRGYHDFGVNMHEFRGGVRSAGS